MTEISMCSTNNNSSYSNRENSSIPNAMVPVNDLNTSENNNDHPIPSATNEKSSSCFSIPFFKKLIAEGIGTFFMIFAGCGAVSVNLNNDKVVTLPGLSAMVMIYALGYISGAHFTLPVTIAFATCGCQKFPWKQAIILRESRSFLGKLPAGSHMQSLVFNRYEGLWIYIIGPIGGAIAGSWTYSFIKNDRVIRKLGSKFY
ncbi:hypothetical protein MKW98_026950 [Papaver atlanticum]|uniref:Uncharacterized protein n=1 Tax=Papaver atlanticum TaxID=357466 RepID=A0AAD4SWN1_9MAGN|nr:hypothetical protein MKW98_026950 [Papaver atlanticum]